MSAHKSSCCPRQTIFRQFRTLGLYMANNMSLSRLSRRWVFLSRSKNSTLWRWWLGTRRECGVWVVWVVWVSSFWVDTEKYQINTHPIYTIQTDFKSIDSEDSDDSDSTFPCIMYQIVLNCRSFASTQSKLRFTQRSSHSAPEIPKFPSMMYQMVLNRKLQIVTLDLSIIHA